MIENKYKKEALRRFSSKNHLSAIFILGLVPVSLYGITRKAGFRLIL